MSANEIGFVIVGVLVVIGAVSFYLDYIRPGKS